MRNDLYLGDAGLINDLYLGDAGLINYPLLVALIHCAIKSFAELGKSSYAMCYLLSVAVILN